LASIVRFAEHDFLSDNEVSPDDVTPLSEFCPSSESGGIPVTVDSEEGNGMSGCVESRRDSALILQLTDAVKPSSKEKTKRGKRRHFEITADNDQAVAMTTATSAASKTSSLTPKRRGKGSAIYVDQPYLAASTPVAETDSDDVADFVVVDSPPSRRARWLDADLEATEQRAFTCSLTRPTLASLEERFGARVIEGRAMPRRCLVDLTDLDEDLIAVDDHTDEQIKSMPAYGHNALPHRLFLVVEELHPLIPRFTSTSGHVICRFVTVVDCLAGMFCCNVRYTFYI